jgi:hypothetical protein
VREIGVSLNPYRSIDRGLPDRLSLQISSGGNSDRRIVPSTPDSEPTPPPEFLKHCPSGVRVPRWRKSTDDALDSRLWSFALSPPHPSMPSSLPSSLPSLTPSLSLRTRSDRLSYNVLEIPTCMYRTPTEKRLGQERCSAKILNVFHTPVIMPMYISGPCAPHRCPYRPHQSRASTSAVCRLSCTLHS